MALFLFIDLNFFSLYSSSNFFGGWAHEHRQNSFFTGHGFSSYIRIP